MALKQDSQQERWQEHENWWAVMLPQNKLDTNKNKINKLFNTWEEIDNYLTSFFFKNILALSQWEVWKAITENTGGQDKKMS